MGKLEQGELFAWKSGWQVCREPNCTRMARSRYGTTCNSHYQRGRSAGTRTGKGRENIRISSHGYRYFCDSSHPVASKSGFVYEHRAVLYEKIGPGIHPCRWCQRALIWFGGRRADALHVDHVDGVKTNNAPKNLEPTCARCNTARGGFLSWLRMHADDPVIERVLAAQGLLLAA